MRYLFNYWNNLKENMKDGSLYVFLDYDGTLTPLRKTPKEAVIPKETRKLLADLSKKRKCKLAIISGRALKDLKKTVGIKNIVYSGNHGLELEGRGLKFQSPISPNFKALVGRIKNGLKEEISDIKGALIEEKGFSLSLHYRLVAKNDLPLLKTIFRKNTASYLKRKQIKIESGKMVWEIRPAIKWDKGKVVLWILAQQKSGRTNKSIIPIYLGDDLTDEDAFKALKNKGLTVFVGKPRPSQAEYYLKNTQEVIKFLKQLLELK
ncbi:MAG: trehalose-phosphatase [Elusimicrobiota bacterium]